MEKKKYLAYYDNQREYEEFDTIEAARKWLSEAIFDPVDLIYSADKETLESCKIYELKEIVKIEVLDSKENYKYLDEEDIPEDSDEEAWPYGNNVDEVWKHEFKLIEH